MAVPAGDLPLGLLSLLALVVGLLFSILVLARLGDPGRFHRRLTDRFVVGIPWGTVVVFGWVLVVYYVLQGGVNHPYDPVVIGFRSWSYFYPTGMLLAPFAHGGMGHLTGNLLAAVVFAPIAEYAWGHYRSPSGSGGGVLRLDTPFRRIAAFVAVTLLVGLATSLFVPGPLIGFSGVVFAFAGFALITFPLLTIVAVVGSQLFRLVYYALQNPIVTAEAQQQFVSPFWAEIAIQAHALGLLLGVVLALTLHRRRGTRPDPIHVWFAGATYAVSESLYALYWYEGANEFVMFRGIGIGIVLVFAGLVPIATMDDREALLPARLGRRLPRSGALPSLPRRRTILVILMAPMLAIGMVAVPFNLADITGSDEPGEGLAIRDYTVTYAEDVPNGNLAAVSIPWLRDSFAVTASGVIVRSERRDVWEEVVPARQLAFDGRATVTVGGIGWREEVVVNRTAWTVVDGGSTFQVFMHRQGEERRRVYVDDPVRVPAILDGRRVRIQPATPGYQIVVSRNNTTLETGPMPPDPGEVRIGGLTFTRAGGTLSVAFDRTRLQIARLKIQDKPRE